MTQYDRYQDRQPRKRLGRLARRKAMGELLRRHQDEYKRLVEDYRMAEGLTPSKVRGRPITPP